MIKSYDGKVEIYGDTIDIDAELYVLFISLFRSKEFKKSDIEKILENSYMKYITKYKIEEEIFKDE